MKSRAPESQVISFRVDAEEFRILAARAASLGVSPHALARFYVSEALLAAMQLSDLGSAVLALQTEVAGQRGDLALSMQALLSSAGKTSAKEAEAWVEKCLNRRPPCSPSQTR